MVTCNKDNPIPYVELVINIPGCDCATLRQVNARQLVSVCMFIAEYEFQRSHINIVRGGEPGDEATFWHRPYTSRESTNSLKMQ